MCYSSIISSPFNFVSNANFVTPLSDTIYQALPSAVLKKRYVLQFGEQYQKAQRDYIEKLKTETVDVYQGIEFMKKIPYVYTFWDTPSYAFLNIIGRIITIWVSLIIRSLMRTLRLPAIKK